MPEAVDRLRRLGGTQVVAKIDVDGVALHAAGDLVWQMGKALGQVWRALDRVVAVAAQNVHKVPLDQLVQPLGGVSSRIRPVALICAKHPSQTQL